MHATENYHQDKQFLKENLDRVPSDDEVFDFIERVSIMIFDGGLTEDAARKLAIKGMLKL